MDVKRYGPWALIVGGSEGIGAGFARKLAAHGFKLVLTARKTGPLEDLAAELRAGGTEVRTLSVDMSKADALDKVRAVTDDVEVGLLVYNAGANSVRGNFVELDPEVYRSVIAVNVLGQAEFSRHYGGLMRQRERGGIILTGSGAGYVGTPSLAAYCASKAFSRVLGEALFGECEKFGVDVLHLVIGYTATPAMERLGYDLSTAQDPAEAAQEGLDNIANGPVWHCGGQINVERAKQQSQIDGRADIVRGVVAPPKK
jgi:short-subunit dehydrogenase